MNTYSVAFTHGRSAVTVISIEAETSDDAWRIIQEDYAGQKCVLHKIVKEF